jgi:hydroxypyruvate reductase
MMRPQLNASESKALLRDMFRAAVASAQPALCVPAHLPSPPQGRLIVIGAGKASAAMARAVEDHWAGPLEGLVVTRYGYGVDCKYIDIVEASHPVPDANGLNAAKAILSSVQNLTEDDLVLCLISGGGSALMPLPLEGISLEDKQAINVALLKSGASISEMNCVRRHLSAIKGGRLAAACFPARVLTLLLSDVPGDDPIDIASGPTVADPTTCKDALAIVRRYAIGLPAFARHVLESGSGESMKPADARMSRSESRLIATPLMALEAAAEVARAAGLNAYILSDAIEGESREVGKVLAAIALQCARTETPFSKPCVLLSGGETTVTVRGKGRGGRNVEFLLALALALRGAPGIHALAADTDGIDGQEEVAGAYIDPQTLERARSLKIDPVEFLDTNDAHTFFERIDDSLATGPTHTNVNDFRVILVQ